MGWWVGRGWVGGWVGRVGVGWVSGWVCWRVGGRDLQIITSKKNSFFLFIFQHDINQGSKISSSLYSTELK